LARRFDAYEALRRRLRGTIANSQSLLGETRSEFVRFDRAAVSGGLGKKLEGGSELRAQEMADLVARLEHRSGIRQVRDPAYLRWRYASPARDYRFVYSRGSRGIDGYLALSTTRGDSFPAIRIADWEGVSWEIKRRLLLAAIRAGHFRQVSIWKFAAAESDLDILTQCGLVPEPAPKGVKGLGITVLAKGLGAEQPSQMQLGKKAIFERSNWDYRMIYSDFV
jgi:hypothetical protein